MRRDTRDHAARPRASALQTTRLDATVLYARTTTSNSKYIQLSVPYRQLTGTGACGEIVIDTYILIQYMEHAHLSCALSLCGSVCTGSRCRSASSTRRHIHARSAPNPQAQSRSAPQQHLTPQGPADVREDARIQMRSSSSLRAPGHLHVR